MSNQQHSSSELSRPEDNRPCFEILHNRLKIEAYQKALEKLNAYNAQVQQILQAMEDEVERKIP